MSSTRRILVETKEHDEKTINSINDCQKNLIEAILASIFDDLSNLKPLDSLFVMHTILNNEKSIHPRIIPFLQHLDIWSHIEFIRKILNHEFPQNRSSGDGAAFCSSVLRGQHPTTPEEIQGCNDGVYQGNVYYFKHGFGSPVLHEPEGLLSLSSKNDETAHPITSTATKNYIRTLFKKEIAKLEEQIADRESLPHPSYRGLKYYSLSSLIRSMRTKEFCDAVKARSYPSLATNNTVIELFNFSQHLHTTYLFIQTCVNLLLFVSDKRKNNRDVVDASNLMRNKIIILETFHFLLRMGNQVDLCYTLSKNYLLNFIVNDESQITFIFSELNNALERVGRKNAFFVTENSVKFNITFRELGKYAVESLIRLQNASTNNITTQPSFNDTNLKANAAPGDYKMR